MNRLIPAIAIICFATSAAAEQPPRFFSDTYPSHAVDAILQAQGVLEGEKAVLDARTRELVSLGVAAQIPCEYCVYAHTRGAKAHGATDAEIREAIAAAATVRMWSTILNGNAYDVDAFKREVDRIGDAN